MMMKLDIMKFIWLCISTDVNILWYFKTVLIQPEPSEIWSLFSNFVLSVHPWEHTVFHSKYELHARFYSVALSLSLKGFLKVAGWSVLSWNAGRWGAPAALQSPSFLPRVCVSVGTQTSAHVSSWEKGCWDPPGFSMVAALRRFRQSSIVCLPYTGAAVLIWLVSNIEEPCFVYFVCFSENVLSFILLRCCQK